MIGENETRLTIKETNHKIAFPTYEVEPDGVSYVRVLNSEGKEVGYWIYDEWVEDPRLVMGAILGALSKEK